MPRSIFSLSLAFFLSPNYGRIKLEYFLPQELFMDYSCLLICLSILQASYSIKLAKEYSSLAHNGHFREPSNINQNWNISFKSALSKLILVLNKKYINSQRRKKLLNSRRQLVVLNPWKTMVHFHVLFFCLKITGELSWNILVHQSTLWIIQVS